MFSHLLMLGRCTSIKHSVLNKLFGPKPPLIVKGYHLYSRPEMKGSIYLFLNVISELILHLWKHQLYVKKIPENVEFPFIVIVCLSKMTNYTLSVKGQSLSI
jgi:hypothetical protein